MRIRNLRREDIPAALAIINDEGWNYTAVELERMLRLDPEGSLICEADAPMGIIMGVSYGRTGVIGHLVVSKKGRGKKIGQTLLAHCLDYFRSVGTDSVILYATEAGGRLYSKNGFVRKRQAFCVNARLPKVAARKGAPVAQLMTGDDIADVIALDAQVFGDDRGKLMDMLCREFPAHSFKIERDGKIVGFILARETPVGYDVGPWVCTSGQVDDAMKLLAAEASTLVRGSMFLGTFTDNVSATAVARGLDSIISWQVDLMVRGKGRYEHDISNVFGVAAFELG